jgi:hypothetical protein
VPIFKVGFTVISLRKHEVLVKTDRLDNIIEQGRREIAKQVDLLPGDIIQYEFVIREKEV